MKKKSRNALQVKICEILILSAAQRSERQTCSWEAESFEIIALYCLQCDWEKAQFAFTLTYRVQTAACVVRNDVHGCLLTRKTVRLLRSFLALRPSRVHCTYTPWRWWCRRAGEADHLVDGEAEFEAMERIADSNLPLDLGIRESRHDSTRFNIRTTGSNVPGRHTYPKLEIKCSTSRWDSRLH